MNKIVRKVKDLSLLTGIIVFNSVNTAMGQAGISSTFEDITDTVVSQGEAILKLIQWIIGVGLAIGLANAIFKVANKKHESYDNVIGWGAGLVLFIVGMMILNEVVFPEAY